jgi:predicted AlkP superfamily phosphohydrolase/phosphomutase
MSNRLLMLGLDSIDWVLMNEWIAEGRLPALQSMLGESRTLLCTEPNRSLPGSIWTDIATGASAAFHGYVHEQQLTPNTYRCDTIDASQVAVAPFYRSLSDAGVRCAVVDFPVDIPQSPFNGVQVVDWGTEFKLWRFETQPKNLAAQLVANYGKHPLTEYGRTQTSLRDLLRLKHSLLRGIKLKLRYAKDLLRQREYDFIFFNFAELHKAGHFFWKFHDRTHPDHTNQEPELLNALRELYEAMDRAVGELLEHLVGSDDIALVTDRGMYADHRGDHLLERLLLKLELATPRGKSRIGDQPRPDTWRSRLLSSRTAVKTSAPRRNARGIIAMASCGGRRASGARLAPHSRV